MRTVEEIKGKLELAQKEDSADGVAAWTIELFKTITDSISPDRLEEICNAERDGRCLSIPKDAHQPMFVKADAVDTFDKWNDVTGAIPNGISWYYEAEAVIEEIAAMAFGRGIFYEAERKAAEATLKERENNG